MLLVSIPEQREVQHSKMSFVLMVMFSVAVCLMFLNYSAFSPFKDKALSSVLCRVCGTAGHEMAS